MKTLKPLTKSIKITFLVILPLFILMSAQIVYSMEITTPKDGETYISESPLTITWNCWGVAEMGVDFTIELLKGSAVIGTIGRTQGIRESYNWSVGWTERTIADPGSGYRIRTTGVDPLGTQYSGISGTFTISPPDTPVKKLPPLSVIKSFLGNLCQIVNCTAVSEPPMITGISPPDFVAEPGAVLNILGQNFGQSQGTVTITGAHFKSIPLKIITWNDTVIMAEVPVDITGVVDQSAWFVVMANDNPFSSNAWYLQFVALRDLMQLPDNMVYISRCGGGAFCYDDCGPLIEATHCTKCCFSGDSDTDSFSTGLFSNGWVIHSYEVHNESDPGTKIIGNYNIVPGSNTLNVSVKWNTSDSGKCVSYGVVVFIKGPRGTQPWH